MFFFIIDSGSTCPRGLAGWLYMAGVQTTSPGQRFAAVVSLFLLGLPLPAPLPLLPGGVHVASRSPSPGGGRPCLWLPRAAQATSGVRLSDSPVGTAGQRANGKICTTNRQECYIWVDILLGPAGYISVWRESLFSIMPAK